MDDVFLFQCDDCLLKLDYLSLHMWSICKLNEVKMMKNRFFIVVLLLVAMLVGASGMYATLNYIGVGDVRTEKQLEQETTVNASDDEVEKFIRALEMIDSKYYKELDRSKLIEGAIEGMILTLEDPNSEYMDKETADKFSESLSSQFQGIGAEVNMVNGQVTIVTPFRDSPAEKAGILPNDKIIEIDGESIEGLSLHEAVLKIRGEKGTKVVLTIQRENVNEPIEITVVRDDIPIETVHAEIIEKQNKKIGLIEITSFSLDTAEHFKEELQRMEKDGIDALIIDVRGNPGGLLDAVQEIGKLVIPKGKPIVQIENREGEKVRYMSKLKEKKPYPIIGITDGGSASASEILAAALIEAGGYDVVGETTFGKGTVQQAIDLGDGSEIKLSLYRWLTSDGNFIHKEGVEPTVKVKQPEYFYLPPINVDEPLQQDMLNEQVKNAQQMLKGLGFEPGRTDGYFNEQTKNAVIAFQKDRGLDVTGIIDEKTAVALHEQVLSIIRDKNNDRQLQTAIQLAIEQSK